ncbi:family 78 glycoside hydrolase catalytic domain [Rhabdothermincola salaria]|uniref:family 78 glycoside hydrolase catalytic domain n=1 Tax=Rhabdothermincola salaria TaxID=2903142 RepID=UPI001E2F41C4|nr:family 78 glycoside hydrolase catalytic domain [Rhabdothermincola salaria]MCD9622414.1 glycoside hydrolase family 78 protein [Rhabdothermincola salaria]
MQPRHPEPFAGRWRAKWIWDGAPALTMETATRPALADPTDKVVLFRRVVEVAAVPESVPCRIWVDGRYVLRVNGKEVARGPVRSDPRQARYDTVDLAPELRVGDNVIGITGRHFGQATSWWMPVPPSYSLGAGSLLFEALLGDEWIVSDRTWRCRRGEAWTPVPVPGDVACLPLESFDAREHPHGWESPSFDDSDWSKAWEITPMHTGAHGDPSPPSEPFGMLRPPVRRSFPVGRRNPAELVGRRALAGETEVLDPVRQVLDDEARVRAGGSGDHGDLLSFDLGHIAAGTVHLVVTGAAEGTIVDVAAAEHLDDDGLLVPLGQHAGFRYVTAGRSEEVFDTLDIIGTRYLHVSVRPPSGEPVPAIGLSVDDLHRPRPEGASFECSDALLNRIYEVGLRTVDLCALDAYVDCPTREQRAWTGDSVVHQMVDLVANPDWSMAAWHPQLASMSRSDGMLAMAVASDFAADDRMFVPDWSLHWVRSVLNLHRYLGDTELVADLLPVAERTLRWFEGYLDDSGLLSDVTGWVLIDWASVYSSGCSSTVNALWARALEDFAEMARALGNEASARWAMSRWAGVRDGFEVFWDEARGVYIDHVVDGVPQRPAAQHGGAAALAAGLVPAERVARVVERLVDREHLLRHSWVMDPVTPTGGSTGYVHLMMGYPPPEWDAETMMVEAEPFFRYVVHEGLARAGRADLIADLCRDWKVFLDVGETTWPECWTGGTRCHGWSSTPTWDLVTHTLGVTPAEPGYASVRVAPRLGDLAWARGVVPTPHGPITVEAHADGSVHVDSPVPVVRA